MAFIKVNEKYGSLMMVNPDKVQLITDHGGGQAKIWFGGNDVDSITVTESFEEVEMMLAVSRGVVDLRQAQAIHSLPAKDFKNG